MTPLGTALLGLRVGDRMPFRTSDGQQHDVLVEDVGFRPLAGVVPYEHLTSCPPRAANAVSPAVTTLQENSRESLDRTLDAALEETFPASDPISSLSPMGSPSSRELTGELELLRALIAILLAKLSTTSDVHGLRAT